MQTSAQPRRLTLAFASSYPISRAIKQRCSRLHYRRNCLSAETVAWEKIQDREEWCNTVSLIKTLGVKEAEKCVAQAFGWTTQKYWQNEKNNELPNPTQVGRICDDFCCLQTHSKVERNVEYLRSVGFGDEDLRNAIEKFPELLGCDCEKRLRPNVEHLQKGFFLKGTHRVQAILRNPRVLGSVIDCEGDCKGQCTRCWSQF